MPSASPASPELGVAWVGDRLVDRGHATVPVDDHGFTTGDGCFETVAVRGGAPFALHRHLRRLASSCEQLGLPPPDAPAIRRACREVVDAAAGGADMVLRIILTAGRAPLSTHRGAGRPTLVVVAGPAPRWPPLARVAVAPWTRNERSPLVGVKTTSYAENVVVLDWARRRGCDEALLTNTRGHLCEGTGSNVFVALGATVVTPPLADGCLAGITRELLLEHTDAVEHTITMDELNAADEVVLTSTTRGVHPVGELDEGRLPAPGAAATALLRAWHALSCTSGEV